MKITPKSPELLHAQALLHADQEIHDSRTMAPLHHTIGVLSTAGVVSPEVAARATEHLGESGDKGEVKPEAHPAFLRDGEKRQASRKLSEMLAAFDGYRGSVEEMGIVGCDVDEAQSHPDYIDHGTEKIAFKLKGRDEEADKDLVAIVGRKDRIGKDKLLEIAEINSRAAALSVAADLEGFERGVAVSYDPAVVITEKAQGKRLDSIDVADRLAIPYAHWNDLEDHVEAGAQQGLEMDLTPGNLIYDPAEGFTVIDYELMPSSRDRNDHAYWTLRKLARHKQNTYFNDI